MRRGAPFGILILPFVKILEIVGPNFVKPNTQYPTPNTQKPYLMLKKYLRGLLIFDDAKHRIGAHVLFWVGYYVYRLYRYIDVYEWTPLVQLLELPVKMLVVYVNLYVLMPFLLSKKKTAYYLLALCFLLVAGGILQTQMIHLMIRMEIYSLPVSRLYTGYKLVSIVGHIIDLLIFTTVIKILKDAYINQQKNHAREKENLHNEMRFLRAQINPHFLFNTLNNLYSLVLTKSDQAPNILLRITELMSYTLYETNQEEVPLDKELLSLEHYIELEKLRFGDEMNVIYSMEGSVEKYMIAPLLLLPFVENSFKHTRPDSQQFSWIRIEGKIERNQWFFRYPIAKMTRWKMGIPTRLFLPANTAGSA